MVLDREKIDLHNEKTSLQDAEAREEQAEAATSKENRTSTGADDDSRHSRCSIETIEALPEDGEEPRTTISMASTVPPVLTVVPQDERRGLFGRFTLVPEVRNSYAYERKTKWLLTMFVALAAAAGPIGSGILMCKPSQHFSE